MAAIAAIPPAAAHHQDHIVMTGMGNVATGYSAPPGWLCTGPTFALGTWEVACQLASSTWCAEPTVDVTVNGIGALFAGVVGVTTCQEWTGGNPGQTLATSCVAVMPPGITTASCSGFSAGYVQGSWIEFICRATPGGTLLTTWTTDCGLITGP